MMWVYDLDFFTAEESAIRTVMKSFERELLSLADQAVKDAGFEVKEYPKEGYYYEAQELEGFFDRLKTLQSNFTETITPAIRELHEIYTASIFGIKQARSTALNPDDVYYKKGDVFHLSSPATISTMVDPITIASDKTSPIWTIEKIMNAIDRNNLGVCLVGLGIIVDQIGKEKNGKYNPLATCMACETTVLTREAVFPTAEPFKKFEIEWKVSPEVEEYGRKVIDGYRSLFDKHSKTPLELPYITPENIMKHLRNAPAMRRCVMINADFLTRRPDPYYHWAIDFSDNRYTTIDFFADRVITTQDWQGNKSAR